MSDSIGTERITRAIEGARQEGRPALLAALPCELGADRLRLAMKTAADAGADLLELRVELIRWQYLNVEALVDCIRASNELISVPVLIWLKADSPKEFRIAVEHLPDLVPLLADAGTAGLVGRVPPDLVDAWADACGDRIAPVFMVGMGVQLDPDSSLCKRARGFLYGIHTGARRLTFAEVVASSEGSVRAARAATGLPVFVAAGIRTPPQAEVLAGLCDGIAVVTGTFGALDTAPSQSSRDFTDLRDTVQGLREGLERGATRECQ
jgi:tryptophan synthase alpha subunit